MTEHERRVNDNDIKAYEAFDTGNLHAKGLPGFGGGHEAERQRAALERALGGSPLTGGGKLVLDGQRNSIGASNTPYG